MALALRARGVVASAAQHCSVCRSQSVTLHLAASTSFRPSQASFSNWASPLQNSLVASGRSRLQARKGRSMATNVMSPTKSAESFYDFTVKDIDGNDINLGTYKGKVVMAVNVASQCGFTPQYKELAQLYDRHKDDGFVILGFPCNQFGQQEPGDNDKVKKFAEERGARFPMMSKIDVNGPSADPVYKYLKQQQKGMVFSDIKWNFSKFLVDRDGNVVKRYGSVTTPLAIEDDIKALL